ncbi:hypothetical protein D3C87_1845010 [compost metagenome]
MLAHPPADLRLVVPQGPEEVDEVTLGNQLGVGRDDEPPALEIGYPQGVGEILGMCVLLHLPNCPTVLDQSTR